MSAQQFFDFDKGIVRSSSRDDDTGAGFNAHRRKTPKPVTVAPENKLLVSREEASQMLSISQRGFDYLIANRRLPTRRIGGRVLIPMADLRKYARGDHPENIVA
jgi:excisionase family DNA binding protein